MAAGRRRADTQDELLAFLLIHTWTLTTGRVLRSDVPPAELSAAELIAFWADAQTAGQDTTAAAHPATRTGRR